MAGIIERHDFPLPGLVIKNMHGGVRDARLNHCYRARLDVTTAHVALPAWPADAHAYSAERENSLATSPAHYTQSHHALPESPASRRVLLGSWGVCVNSAGEQRYHFLPDVLLHGQGSC
jgi:hypothetical protein